MLPGHPRAVPWHSLRPAPGPNQGCTMGVSAPCWPPLLLVLLFFMGEPGWQRGTGLSQGFTCPTRPAATPVIPAMRSGRYDLFPDCSNPSCAAWAVPSFVPRLPQVNWALAWPAEQGQQGRAARQSPEINTGGASGRGGWQCPAETRGDR